MAIYHSVIDLVGNTPLLELTNYEAKNNLQATLLAKLEYFNPAGSVKDRIAKAMIEDAEAKGLLTPDSVIIEPTSGNTGIGLAAVATAKGYRIIIVMPETMSIERRNLMKAYGAELVLTEGAKGRRGPSPRPMSWRRKFPTPSSPASSSTQPTPPLTKPPPARRFGPTLRARWTSLWQAWAPAAPSPAWVPT